LLVLNVFSRELALFSRESGLFSRESSLFSRESSLFSRESGLISRESALKFRSFVGIFTDRLPHSSAENGIATSAELVSSILFTSVFGRIETMRAAV